jgi:tRNA(Ile)-lysidine synthase
VLAGPAVLAATADLAGAVTRPTDAVRAAVRRSLASVAGPRDGRLPLALVACSGGADSLALAAGAAQASRQAGWAVGAVVVDHGLQAGSDHAAEQAGEQCRGLGLDPVLVRTVTVPDSDLGPEAAARQARYESLAETARQTGASAVLLGHTLDDQAETVLLGLARGSGSRSLAGMAPARALADGSTAVLLRPLLGLTRSTTEQACQDWRLAPWQDPHNSDRSYTRVRVRRDVLPALTAALGPGVAAALARTADLLREDEQALSAIAAETADRLRQESGPAGTLPCALLAPHPPAIRRRVLRDWVIRAGVPAAALTAGHLRAIDALVSRNRPSAAVRLPGGVEAVVRYGRLELARRQE